LKESDEFLLNEMDEEVLNDVNEEEGEEKKKKEEERVKKAQALWKAVQNEETKHLTTRVAMILNKYPETRNSDITLQIRYWQSYNGLTGNSVSLENLYKYERLTSIARARAKIQNEYKLFLADTGTRNRRRAKADQEKEAQLLEKPTHKIMNIFADETGKTADYIIVGGVWFLEPQRMARLQASFLKWSNEQDKKLPSEFHFKEMDNRSESEYRAYKEFFNLILKSSDMVSFKAVGVNKTKLKRMKVTDIVNTMYYQLIRMGITHEIATNRIELPRRLNVTKDKDDESSLVIEQMKQNLQDKFKIHYRDNLLLDQLVPVDSKELIELQ
ncbi:hypothetical protein HHU09_21405, partial [Bacillus clausii]|nr:hypothetical protein [Shouchella clausii]